MENSMKAPQKLKNRTTIMIQQFYFWVYTQEKEKRISWCYMHFLFIAALFTIAKMWKQPKCTSMNEWIKMWCVHTYLILLHFTDTVFFTN